MNWMSEYIIMYLNRPNDVTKAQRPSSAKCFMQVIFSSFDVNGAATDASAYSFWNQEKMTESLWDCSLFGVCKSKVLMKCQFTNLWQWNANVSSLQWDHDSWTRDLFSKMKANFERSSNLDFLVGIHTLSAPQSFAPSPHIATM